MTVFKQLKINDRTTANRIILYVDSQEPKSIIRKAQKLGFPIRQILLRLKGERYSFGDYLIGISNVLKGNSFAFIIERKTIGDLVSSAREERFYRQIKYMAEVAELYNMIPILYLVGSIREWRAKERIRIKRDFAKKKIKHLYEPASISKIEDNITDAHLRILDIAPTMIIRHVCNDIQMLRTIYGYAQGAMEKRIGSPRPRRITEVKRKYAFQASLIATAFNLSERKAQAIISEFGSFKEFTERASKDNLIYGVKGIGQVNAEMIMKRHRLLFE